MMVRKILCSIFLICGSALIGQNKISDVLNYSEKVEKISIASEEIAYVDKGSGVKTLLFIHGLSSNLEAWKKNIGQLQDKYRCIAVDLPGYGKSSRNSPSYSLSDYSQFIKDFIKKKELENVILVGHSMGGQIAVHSLLSSQDLFDKLILIAPAGIETFSSQEAVLMKSSYTAANVINSNPEQITANYKMNFHSFPEDAHFMVQDRIEMQKTDDFPRYAEIVVNNVHAMLNEPVFDRLAEISIPVLMIYGKNDLLIPNRFFHPNQNLDSIIEDAQENISNLRVEMIEEAGHFVNFEKAAEVNEEIDKFIKSD
jgi:pimeloyl-ACP methyl ester carboxylesterase